MPVDIVILTHSRDRRLARSDHTINILAGHWRRMGLSVAAQRGLPRRHVEAAIAINHVDLTVTPPDHVAWLDCFPATVNRQLTDISKTRLCSDLVSSGESYDGPVIVKTDQNHGGLRERRLADMRASRWRRVFRAAASRFRNPVSQRHDISLSDARSLDPYAYPVFETASLVPDGVWRNPSLVVQKFLPEKDRDDRYRLRCWYLLGDHGFHVVTLATDPIVKGSNIVDRRVVDVETPAELIAIRAKIGMDYGRVDYVVVDDRPVVYDINRTPTSSPAAVELYAAQWNDLAKGIRTFLP